MALQNLISISITAAELQQMDDALAVIETVLANKIIHESGRKPALRQAGHRCCVGYPTVQECDATKA